MTDSLNLDLVRSIYVDWERGDFSATDWAHPEIEYVWVEGPSPGSWTGLAALEAAFREFLTTWDELRNFAEEYRELDDERVLVLVNFSGRGKSSGVELGQMQTKAAALFHVREGKVTRNVHYFDRDRALADLGLSPEAGSP